jgi:hypothetical protein
MARSASIKPTNVAPVNPRYRAPEALTDPNMHNQASDIFMFGCIMWEIFTRSKVTLIDIGFLGLGLVIADPQYRFDCTIDLSLVSDFERFARVTQRTVAALNAKWNQG